MAKEKNIKIINGSCGRSAQSSTDWSACGITEDGFWCWGRSLMNFARRSRCISNAGRSTNFRSWGSSSCPSDARNLGLRPCVAWWRCNRSHSVRLGWWSCIVLMAPLAVLRSKCSWKLHVLCKLRKSWCLNRRGHFLLWLFTCGLSSLTCWPRMDFCLEKLLAVTSPWVLRLAHLVQVTSLRHAPIPDFMGLVGGLGSAWKWVSVSLQQQLKAFSWPPVCGKPSRYPIQVSACPFSKDCNVQPEEHHFCWT